MNVLHLMFSFTTGGAEQIVADLCNHMSLRGVPSYLCVINRHYDRDMLDRLSPDIRLYLMDRPAGSGSLISYVRRLANYIREHQIHIVHCHEIDGVVVCTLLKVLCRRIKIITTIHAVNLFRTAPAWKRLLVRKVSDRIVCISNAVREELTHAGIRESKTALIYNGIDAARFPVRGAPKKALAPTDTIRIGHVARLDIATKGQDLLVQALECLLPKYPHLLLQFAGDVYPPQTEQYLALKEHITSRGLGDHINFLGNIFDVPAFLATLDLFVLPSLEEGFGLSLIEAMSTGLPCIASDAGGLPEIMDDPALGLLFHTGDVRDLSEKIDRMITDYASFSTEAISASVHERFSLSSMVASYLTLYRTLCPSR